MPTERSKVSTLALVALPTVVVCVYVSLHAFADVHGSGIFILLIFVLPLLALVSLVVVPMTLLKAHRTWRSVPSQKSAANLAKIMSGWLYLIGLTAVVVFEMSRSWRASL